MRSLFFILQKEIAQMKRRRGLLRTLFIAPIIQLILFPMAANFSVKDISVAVVDNDHSSLSAQMIQKIVASGSFKLYATVPNNKDALKLIEQDKADLIIEIPAHFERDIVRNNGNKISVQINAIEGVKGGLSAAYLGQIIQDFNSDFRLHYIPQIKSQARFFAIPLNWYNPYLIYFMFMVPGIMVTLVTSIALMQSAFNLVNEKEIGTIEQINVTPVKKHIFLLGKLIPFYILSIVIFTIGLFIGYVIYGVYPLGSYASLYISLFLYLFALIGFGLLLSTYSDTQQQVMSLAFFFLNIINMMSGLFTNIDSMPLWARLIADCFPVSHFIKIMRMIVLKGSTLTDVAPHLIPILIMGIVFNTWAVLNYRKTS